MRRNWSLTRLNGSFTCSAKSRPVTWPRTSRHFKINVSTSVSLSRASCNVFGARGTNSGDPESGRPAAVAGFAVGGSSIEVLMIDDAEGENVGDEAPGVV